jgi:signal recognition particle GTPase
LTGIALTKLDGTAKGGIIFALAKKAGVPIRFHQKQCDQKATYSLEKSSLTYVVEKELAYHACDYAFV